MIIEHINAQEVPEEDLEITADVVRLARATAPGTRAEALRLQVEAMYPEANETQVRRCFGYAARLLS